MRYRSLWALILILTLIQVLVLPLLTIDAPWYDEVITYQRIGGPPFELSRNIVDVVARTAQFWSPLYFILLSIWGNLVGNSLFALRYWSLLVGLLAAVWVYRVAADLISRRTGLITVFLLSTSSFFLHYNHDMRAYTLYILLGMIAVWTYWQVMYKGRKQFIWWLHLSLVVLFYTHFVAMVMVASVFIYHGFQYWRHPTGRGRQLIRHWRRLFILFVPELVLAAKASAAEGANPRGLDFFEIWPTLFHDFGNGMGWLLLGLVIYGIYIGRKQPAVQYLVILSGIYLVLAVGVNFVVDYLFHMRHILLLLPVFLLLVSLAINDLWQRAKPLAAIVVLLWAGAGVGATTGWVTWGTEHIRLYLPVQPFDEAQAFIRACVQDGDTVIFHMTNEHSEADVYPTLVYYVAQNPVRFEQIRTFTSAEASRLPTKHVESEIPYRQLAQEFVDGSPRVWLLMPSERANDPIVAEFGQALAEINYSAPQQDNRSSSDLVVLVYTQPTATGCTESQQ